MSEEVLADVVSGLGPDEMLGVLNLRFEGLAAEDSNAVVLRCAPRRVTILAIIDK